MTSANADQAHRAQLHALRIEHAKPVDDLRRCVLHLTRTVDGINAGLAGIGEGAGDAPDEEGLGPELPRPQERRADLCNAAKRALRGLTETLLACGVDWQREEAARHERKGA